MYMAPEMIRHELYTSKADVFSWGVLLAEVLSQRPPYEGLYMTPVQVYHHLSSKTGRCFGGFNGQMQVKCRLEESEAS